MVVVLKCHINFSEPTGTQFREPCFYVLEYQTGCGDSPSFRSDINHRPVQLELLQRPTCGLTPVSPCNVPVISRVASGIVEVMTACTNSRGQLLVILTDGSELPDRRRCSMEGLPGCFHRGPLCTCRKPLRREGKYVIRSTNVSSKYGAAGDRSLTSVRSTLNIHAPYLWEQ